MLRAAAFRPTAFRPAAFRAPMLGVPALGVPSLSVPDTGFPTLFVPALRELAVSLQVDPGLLERGFVGDRPPGPARVSAVAALLAGLVPARAA